MSELFAGHPHAGEQARQIAEAGTLRSCRSAAVSTAPASVVRAPGRVTLPIPEPELSALREVRRGEWALAGVLDWLADLEAA